MHLGLGAFHRAHQALVYEHLIAGGDPRWGVVGVAMRSTQLADALAAQDGLYAVQIADADSVRWQIPGALLRTCVAARERQQVVDAMAAPQTRWITLTVTEKGYTPELAALIVDGLAQRMKSGLPGVTVASCDNLSDNGRKLQALCLSDAVARDPALLAWIEARCAFPNSMVDRIVPAATDAQHDAAAAALGVDDRGALSTEAFWEWVIERRMADPSDADLLARAGVTVVDDVKPFEDAKLRMLNGSHTALAMIGAVQGWATVADGIAQPGVRRFVHAFMTRVAMPSLSRPGLPDYRDALLARFANPHLHHRAHQIASDSSLKIPLRWGPPLADALAAGRELEPLALACAAWMRYLRGEDEAGRAYDMSDPQAEALKALARQHAGDAEGTVRALLSVATIWPAGCADEVRWAPRVLHWLRRIDAGGLAAALDEVVMASP
ncbi:mannitol dehydrogenase family protein [Variovorax saccharolyticus]|uniref:mannitol dehydrogenase family protein n=1 Tax=Variovorax saccharolyticus TaxID=3053516 RepID=UPI0025759C16|nr:mannitol dehydrogenase family protein [Variovorax sp. J31P216]MDM0024358.1 mannitol dehydrogenase family protein [Variovorax sp. J31P216]